MKWQENVIGFCFVFYKYICIKGTLQKQPSLYSTSVYARLSNLETESFDHSSLIGSSVSLIFLPFHKFSIVFRFGL